MTETKDTPELPDANYLTTDNDSHWYVVPVAKRAEWEEWLEIDPDDERAWEPPVFARPVNGGPSLVEFSSWRIR